MPVERAAASSWHPPPGQRRQFLNGQRAPAHRPTAPLPNLALKRPIDRQAAQADGGHAWIARQFLPMLAGRSASTRLYLRGQCVVAAMRRSSARATKQAATRRDVPGRLAQIAVQRLRLAAKAARSCAASSGVSVKRRLAHSVQQRVAPGKRAQGRRFGWRQQRLRKTFLIGQRQPDHFGLLNGAIAPRLARRTPQNQSWCAPEVQLRA